MRLIVMGQQAFGQAVLEKLLECGNDQVLAVYCAPDKEGRPTDPLKSAALNAGIPVRQPASYRDPSTLTALRELKPDLMIMAYFTLFVPDVARTIPRMGSICFHPSLLPLHRGPSSINWPIIAGATKTGFSWFYPTDGLDEGDILLQKEIPIGPDDTLGDVYFKKIFPAGTQSVLEVCDLFRSENPPRTTQDESQSTYESWCRKSDAKIDWFKPVDQVYNLIRGTNPQPGAWTTLDGDEVQIFNCRKVDGDGNPGEINEITGDGVVIQAGGGRICAQRVRPAGCPKISAMEWCETSGVKAGRQVGN